MTGPDLMTTDTVVGGRVIEIIGRFWAFNKQTTNIMIYGIHMYNQRIKLIHITITILERVR